MTGYGEEDTTGHRSLADCVMMCDALHMCV
jgi:hypothetical protein